MDWDMGATDMNEMWDMFMNMGGADGFMAMDGGFGGGKGKGKGKGFGKGKKMGGGCDGFGGFDGMCKGKGKKGIDPKVAAAIQACIQEIEERENGGGAGAENLMMGEMGDMPSFTPTPEATKAAPTPSAAPMGGGGGGSGVPEIKRLEVTSGQLALEGFNPVSFGVEFSKEHAIFSESHHILNELLFVPGKFDLTGNVEFVHDPDASVHPEVYGAWTSAGGNENLQCVAKVKELGKWGVGFGGKKNAERAAKLALAIAIGMESDQAPELIRRQPGFGRAIERAGSLGAGGAPAGFAPY